MVKNISYKQLAFLVHIIVQIILLQHQTLLICLWGFSHPRHNVITCLFVSFIGWEGCALVSVKLHANKSN